MSTEAIWASVGAGIVGAIVTILNYILNRPKARADEVARVHERLWTQLEKQDISIRDLQAQLDTWRENSFVMERERASLLEKISAQNMVIERQTEKIEHQAARIQCLETEVKLLTERVALYVAKYENGARGGAS